MTTLIDVLTDLDFELISMTDDELHEFATAASAPSRKSSAGRKLPSTHLRRQAA